MNAQGRGAEARPFAQRALFLAELGFGPEHASCDDSSRARRSPPAIGADARRTLEAALATKHSHWSPERDGEAHLLLAQALSVAGEPVQARVHADKAREAAANAKRVPAWIQRLDRLK